MEANRILIDCAKEKERLDREERKRLLLEELKSMDVRVTMCGKYYFAWKIGKGANAVCVCRDAFHLAHHISSWYTDELITLYKNGAVNGSRMLNDRSSYERSAYNDKKVAKFCKHFNIALTRAQVRAMKVPNSLLSLTTVAWMNYFFKLMGDNCPNKLEELHLEPVKKQEIYAEYCCDVNSYDDISEPISLQLFLELWRSVFSYVKIRKFKHCCGKCNLCSRLSELRRQFQDARGREEVTMLFVLHRTTYMGEREAYYGRRHLALHEKWNYLSTITDGMQQNRCMLPWFGHNKTSPVHIKQHLQGVLMHGRQMRVYRSFSNVSVNGNFCIHTWLLSLEEQYKKGKLPSTIFHQIDGGSENANIMYLVICFLLVAKGLVTRVELTRLLPGHTHEDIDALFALIWNMLKDEYCLSPEEFKKLIMKSFSSLPDVEVIDIFAVPAYDKWIEGYVDSSFERFAKEEWTQLKFNFESCGEDERERYPLGVKVTYSAYAQGEAIEIVDDPLKESITGLIPQLTKCPEFPLKDEPPIALLKAIPPRSRPLSVDPFIAGSRAFTVDCCDRMERSYLDKKPGVAAEWKLWREELSPQTDEATDYIAEHPLYVPFFEQLFSGAPMSDYQVAAKVRKSRVTERGVIIPPMRKTVAVNSVRHEGNRRKANSSRLVVETADGEDVAEENIAAKAHIDAPPRKKRVSNKKSTTANPKPKSKKAASVKKKTFPSARQLMEEKMEESGEDDKDDVSVHCMYIDI